MSRGIGQPLLERAGEVVLGVVHDPMAGETYAAERGGGKQTHMDG
jgi:fructose-1,6-bisphosphatase/inositol monophosphatase family enzyme